MKALSLRFVQVSPEAAALLKVLDGLGLPRVALPPEVAEAGFSGGIVTVGESWVEVWQASPEMPAHTMLQIVVDDADAFAAHARAQGLAPEGPAEMHGEKVYFLKAGDLPVSFQSKLPG